ncbi:MAG: CvpA family protein [Patescibacteria group bacterium]|nr:CvpA family protein [Patescibacteria group bacterium]
MSLFDTILLIIMGGFGLFGLWFGLVHTLGSLVGTVFGVYFASRYYEPAANWLINITGWNENLARVIMFAVAFVIINRLIGLCFWFLDKILSFITNLPFIKSINKLLGMIFGLFEGALVLGIIFYFISKFPLSEYFMSYIAQSQVAPITVKTASILWPLLPEAIRMLQGTAQGLI